MNYKILFVLCLLGLIIISPVLAVDPPNTGEDLDVRTIYTDYQSYGFTGGSLDFAGASGRDLLSYLVLRDADYYKLYDLTAVRLYSKIATNNFQMQTKNSSYATNVYLTNSTFFPIGKATVTYSIDMNNNVYVEIGVTEWNGNYLISTGTENILLNWTHIPAGQSQISLMSVAGNIYDDADAGIPVDWNQYGVSFTRYTPYGISDCNGMCGIQVGYSSVMDFQYDRNPAPSLLPYNVFWLLTLYSGSANIELSEEIVSGSWNISFSGASLNPGTYTATTRNGTKQKLEITDVITGNTHTHIWLAGSSNTQYSLFCDKGTESTDYLIAMENANCNFNYNGLESDITSINWAWSKGVSTGTGTVGYDYYYNASSPSTNKWELNYNPYQNYTFNQLKSKIVQFMYDDFDNNWSSTHSPHNFVRIGLFRNNVLVNNAVTQYLWVGNSNLNPQTRFNIKDVYNHFITNGQLYVYDNTSAAYVVNGETLYTGQKLTSAIIGHSYTVWGTVLDYNYISNNYDIFNNNALERIVNIAPDFGQYTVVSGGIKEDNIVFQFGGLNETYYPKVTFHATDADYNLPASGTAHVCSSDGSLNINGQACEDDLIISGYGNTLFTEVGKNYSYVVSPNSGTYIPVSGFFTATSGLVIEIKFYLPGETPTIPTTTTVPTTTTTTPVPGGPGYMWYQPLINLLALYGITVDGLKLILAALIMGSFAGVIGYYVQSPDASLVGATIGFLLCLGIGIIPIWIAIIGIIIFGLIYGRKYIGSGG